MRYNQYSGGGGGGFSVFPPVIKFLLFANVGIFLITGLLDLRVGSMMLSDAAIEYFALWPFNGGFQPWQLISYQFLHGGFSHILFNMFALWMFGMELENVWGSRRFGVYYLLSGIAAGIVHLLVSLATGSAPVPTLGASGSIMGVLLAFGMLFPDRPVMMFPIFFPIPARIFVLGYAALDLILGVTNAADGVAHFAHLGGALGGFLLIKFGEPLFRWIDTLGSSTAGTRQQSSFTDVRYRDVEPQHHAQRNITVHYVSPDANREAHEPPPAKRETATRFVVDGENISQERIDAILDKISHGGYHSLTEREKFILFEVSRQL